MSKLYLLAENIRSIYNIGSFFRTADAAGLDKLILTGLSAHPPHPRLSKTALGASESVEWEYHQTATEVITQLQTQNFEIVSLEITTHSKNIFDYKPIKDTCLIVGHEVDGVSKESLDLSDEILHIPMLGKKQSLNVSNATAVALYYLQNVAGNLVVPS